MAFNVFDYAVDSIEYPERHPVVYMNARAGSRINDLRVELDKNDHKTEDNGGLSRSRIAAIRKEIKELQKELDKSRRDFHVRGFSPEVREIIEQGVRDKGEEEGWDEERTTEEITYAIFAKAIVSVSNADGEKDEQKWEADNVRDFMKRAPNGSLTEFTNDIIHVTVRAVEFHAAIDVTFS